MRFGGPRDGQFISTVMTGPNGWTLVVKNALVHLLKADFLPTHVEGKLSVRASACVCVRGGALTLVCHCHVFTQCYELQPWHCFRTPDMLLRPHSSAWCGDLE